MLQFSQDFPVHPAGAPAAVIRLASLVPHSCLGLYGLLFRLALKENVLKSTLGWNGAAGEIDPRASSLTQTTELGCGKGFWSTPWASGCS